jgi:LmbE family N-acetylglucosaminyl deacetylase
VVLHQQTNNRHPDHRTTGEIIRDACFLAGLKNFPIDGEPYRPRKIAANYNYNSDQRPSFLVDISDCFDAKLDAIACHESQFPRGEQKLAPHLGFGNVYEWVQARNRQWGMMIRVQFAEAYTITECMQVDDLVTMPVASI